MKMSDYEFPEVVDFWPDYLRQKELEEQAEKSREECEDFEWDVVEIEPNLQGKD